MNEIIQGDCLQVMKDIPDASIDMILCDLPYGTTQCKWDSVIPFEPLWEQYERVAKPNAAIALTAAQPFTSALVMSNPDLFRYELVWDKLNRYTGFLDAKRKPLKRHESVLLFYAKQPTYNPQMGRGKPYQAKRSGGGAQVYNAYEIVDGENDGSRYPHSLLAIKADTKATSYHPTQKPVALFEYLIRTYTNEGDVVLDNCIGSGTTAIAAIRTNRKFIGIEQDPEYVVIARERIANAQPRLLAS